LKRSEYWSVLPVYTLDSYLQTITFQGLIIVTLFEEWLEFYLLPICNPFREIDIRNIIIMDNCSIHCNPRV
ncbi:hypothetical protein NA56DRAFT_527968, partial [Hyaloscypha hepaticicola]